MNLKLNQNINLLVNLSQILRNLKKKIKSIQNKSLSQGIGNKMNKRNLLKKKKKILMIN